VEKKLEHKHPSQQTTMLFVIIVMEEQSNQLCRHQNAFYNKKQSNEISNYDMTDCWQKRRQAFLPCRQCSHC
jgi:hypothetical protein